MAAHYISTTRPPSSGHGFTHDHPSLTTNIGSSNFLPPFKPLINTATGDVVASYNYSMPSITSTSSASSSDAEESMSDTSSSDGGSDFTPSSSIATFCSTDLGILAARNAAVPLPRKISHPRDQLLRLHALADSVIESDGQAGWMRLEREIRTWFDGGLRKIQEGMQDEPTFRAVALLHLKLSHLSSIYSHKSHRRQKLPADEARAQVKLFARWKEEISEGNIAWDRIRELLIEDPPPSDPCLLSNTENDVLHRLMSFIFDPSTTLLDLSTLRSSPPALSSLSLTTITHPDHPSQSPLSTPSVGDILQHFPFLDWCDWLSGPLEEGVIRERAKSKEREFGLMKGMRTEVVWREGGEGRQVVGCWSGREVLWRVRKINLSSNDLRSLPSSLLYHTRTYLECLDLSRNPSLPNVLPSYVLSMPHLKHIHVLASSMNGSRTQPLALRRKGTALGLSPTRLQEACVKVLREVVSGDGMFPGELDEKSVKAKLGLPDEDEAGGGIYDDLVRMVASSTPCTSCELPILDGQAWSSGIEHLQLDARESEPPLVIFRRRFKHQPHPVEMDDPDRWMWAWGKKTLLVEKGLVCSRCT